MKRTGVVCLVLVSLLCSVLTFGADSSLPLGQGDPPSDPPVVYVHYDYMAGFDSTLGTYVSFAPPPEAIQTVVDSFRKHGVILHIDPQHNVIPYHEVVTPDWDPRWQGASTSCTGNDAVSFMALKTTYFNPHDNRPWHYAIFVHNAGVPDTFADGNACPQDPICLASPDPTSTGSSELPGFNFMVALGYPVDIGNTIGNETWAGTFMHELGHNFGLRHGGVYLGPQSCIASKPNYVSVMDSMYQLGGITYSTNGDPTHPTGIRIDYSDETLPTLNEADLDETAGVGSVLHPNDLIVHCALGFGCTLRAFASGPIDWNNNGTATDLHLAVDIDASGAANTQMVGFNDWAYISQFIRIPAYQGGHIHGTSAQ